MKSELKKFFNNKKIIVTGHTGFKGSWLALWLKMLGAKVLGVSNSIPSSPSHFNSIKLSKKINHKKMDIRDIRKLKALFRSYKYGLWNDIFRSFDILNKSLTVIVKVFKL